MGNNLYKILGTVFMLMSGVLYTAERIVAKHSAALIASEDAARGIPVNRITQYPHFFENFFVWFFLLVGFVLLAYGFPKKPDH